MACLGNRSCTMPPRDNGYCANHQWVKGPLIPGLDLGKRLDDDIKVMPSAVVTYPREAIIPTWKLMEEHFGRDPEPLTYLALATLLNRGETTIKQVVTRYPNRFEAPYGVVRLRQKEAEVVAVKEPESEIPVCSIPEVFTPPEPPPALPDKPDPPMITIDVIGILAGAGRDVIPTTLTPFSRVPLMDQKHSRSPLSKNGPYADEILDLIVDYGCDMDDGEDGDIRCERNIERMSELAEVAWIYREAKRITDDALDFPDDGEPYFRMVTALQPLIAEIWALRRHIGVLESKLKVEGR